MVAAAALAAPASAQTSVLSGHVGTTLVPTISESYTNATFASLTTLTAHDVLGNDGVAGGSLATPAGELRLTPHACSGGGPGFSGTANGSASASITLDYRIASTTLPTGTPVQVLVKWAVRSRVTALGQDMVGSNTGANASATAHVALYPNYVIILNKLGTYSRTTSAAGDQVIRSGVLNPEADSGEHIYVINVGQIIRVFLSAEVGANSSVESGTTDGDVQFVGLWGVSSLDPNASVVLNSNPSEPAPPAGMATPDRAIAVLDPRAPYLLPCFRIPTQPVDAEVCGAANASFSAAVQGAGPFTYQWRKNGVPIDNDVYPSATTATLLLNNVSPGDAGSYDVVISNACGDIVSDPATLTVCPAAAVPVRLALTLRSYPNPFNPSTAVSFVLPEAGDINLGVFDLRGACVKVLHRGHLEAGEHAVTWDGRNERGSAIASGVYLVRLETAGGARSLRLTMLE
ncbi:MAG: T9SS type A sorting domain-containing protein [bacterium]|nr:T9SS type A sorting domain-containing protein [bacterium]